jgi:hypothetical protein
MARGPVVSRLAVLAATAVAAAIGLSGCGGGEKTDGGPPADAPARLVLTTPASRTGGTIPERYVRRRG